MNTLDLIAKKRDGGEHTRRRNRVPRQRLHARRHPRLSDERVADGRRLARPDGAGDLRPHRRDGRLRRHAGPERPARHARGQAQHRRGGGQDDPGRRPHPRLGGRPRRQDVRARPRPHRRHAGQTGVHPRHPRQSVGRGDTGAGASRRGLPLRPDGNAGARRPETVRPARRHGDRGVAAPDRRQRHEQEARLRRPGHRPGCQSRRRRVYEDAGRRPRPGRTR